MRQSKLFTKTLKTVSEEETSANARLLLRGGFVYKNAAGVYTFLPLGWRVIGRLKQIIREEMNAIGGVEMFMPALVARSYLGATGRFDLDVGFDVLGKGEERPSFALGWTHEEVLSAIASNYVNSYKDLPFYAYQIQTKFRNEPRAKSGLLRGREFLMKDLYSFHTSERDLFEYYDKAREAYFRVFERCGLKAYYTVAAGGDFTVSNTHEFQVLADVGEDTIFYCEKCEYSENSEISQLQEGDACPKCGGTVKKGSSIEVGNIFPLGTKYSEAFGLNFKDENGETKPVVMGSYGIGVSRLMATIVEAYHDEAGIVWPESASPFRAHLVALSGADGEAVKKEAAALYEELQNAGVEVLYDDREDLTAGEQFADADLIGIPWRLVVSAQSLEKGGVEIKKRSEKKTQIIPKENVSKHLGKI